jgi:hypothetical protein
LQSSKTEPWNEFNKYSFLNCIIFWKLIDRVFWVWIRWAVKFWKIENRFNQNYVLTSIQICESLYADKLILSFFLSKM